MFGNELAEDLVLSPVLLLAVPAAVTETQAAATSLQGSGATSRRLVAVGTQVGVVDRRPGRRPAYVHDQPIQRNSERQNLNFSAVRISVED